MRLQFIHPKVHMSTRMTCPRRSARRKGVSALSHISLSHAGAGPRSGKGSVISADAGRRVADGTDGASGTAQAAARKDAKAQAKYFFMNALGRSGDMSKLHYMPAGRRGEHLRLLGRSGDMSKLHYILLCPGFPCFDRGRCQWGHVEASLYPTLGGANGQDALMAVCARGAAMEAPAAPLRSLDGNCRAQANRKPGARKFAHCCTIRENSRS